MKHTHIFFLGVLAAGCLYMAGCNKKLDDAYANPNAAVRKPVESILPAVEGSFVGSSSAAGSAYGLAGDALLIGRYIQYWGTYNITSPAANGGTQYDQMGGTIGSSDNLGSIWAAHYYGMGQNINRIIQWGTEEQKWDYVGAAWAIRAWSLFQATNEYNEIILREAFNTSLQTFNYNLQPEVYDSVRAICFRSLGLLSRTDGNVNAQNFANGDAFFNGGDIGKWKKFVYGILARSYAYLNNKSTYNADSVIKYARLSCDANTDNITCKFAATGISGTSNYFGPFRGNVGTIRQSQYIADLMSGNNAAVFNGVTDPRLPYLLRENANGTYKGIIPYKSATISNNAVTVLPAGINSTSDLPDNFWGNGYVSTSAPSTDKGRYLFRDGAPFPIMTASEMQFLLAEAAYRKGDKATALAAYANGISLNIDMLATTYATNVPSGAAITPASKTAYTGNTAIVPASPDGLNISMIMLQKYIALYGWGVQETWADMRRFHYTDKDPATGLQVYAGFNPPSVTGDLYINNNGKLVYRARPRYNSEYLYNIPSLKTIGALDPDYHTKPTWFSQP